MGRGWLYEMGRRLTRREGVGSTSGRIERNGELLELRGAVPENVQWPLQAQLRLQCPACNELITADPFFTEVCPCGRLTRGGTSDTVQIVGYPLASISVWRVVPKEDLADVDALLAVLGAIMIHVGKLGDQQMKNAVARYRRLLAGGDRTGAREIVERLQLEIDRMLESEAVDDPGECQAIRDLGLQAAGLAQAMLASE